MAETVGASKSSVSREAIAAREEEFKRLGERRFDDVEIRVLYLGGITFGEHHVLATMGNDSTISKHVPELSESPSGNQVVAKGQLENLVRRGIQPDRRRLIAIDGPKALRGAINEVFGVENPVQRCRQVNIENVMGYLPEHLRGR